MNNWSDISIHQIALKDETKLREAAILREAKHAQPKTEKSNPLANIASTIRERLTLDEPVKQHSTAQTEGNV